VLVFLEIGQYFFLLFYLPAVVLCLLVRHFYFELVVVELFLLSFDLDAELHVLFFEAVLLPCYLLAEGLLWLWLVEDVVSLVVAAQTVDELLTLLCQHFDLFLLVRLFVQVVLVLWLPFELRYFDFLH
jgi:hypothetical protein